MKKLIYIFVILLTLQISYAWDFDMCTDDIQFNSFNIRDPRDPFTINGVSYTFSAREALVKSARFDIIILDPTGKIIYSKNHTVLLNLDSRETKTIKIFFDKNVKSNYSFYRERHSIKKVPAIITYKTQETRDKYMSKIFHIDYVNYSITWDDFYDQVGDDYQSLCDFIGIDYVEGSPEENKYWKKYKDTLEYYEILFEPYFDDILQYVRGEINTLNNFKDDEKIEDLYYVLKNNKYVRNVISEEGYGIFVDRFLYHQGDKVLIIIDDKNEYDQKITMYLSFWIDRKNNKFKYRHYHNF